MDSRNTLPQNEYKSCWNLIGVWGKQSPRCEKLQSVIHCRNCQVFTDAGRQVFNRELPAGYMEQWTADIAQPKITPVKDTVSIICVRLGNEWYALPTKLFKEVTGLRKLHRIPHQADNLILGVINIGGAMQLCFSLQAVLNPAHAPDKPQNSNPRYIVLTIESEHYVFPVDEIGGVFRYSESQLKPVPDTLNSSAAELLLGVIDINKRRIGCIDALKLHYALERKIGE